MKLLLFIILLSTCNNSKEVKLQQQIPSELESPSIKANSDTITISSQINTKNTKPKELITFAKTLIGTPYQYGSKDIDKGFDCSGFITYVFNHFNISVPRSSRDFSSVGKEVAINKAQEGDLILFTGTSPTDKEIGHMGIITQNNDTIKFIHSTSGKAYGVTETPYNTAYQKRFVKVIRVF